MSKIFALYLPQFHEIEENDRWWGKGFTEWTNVKKAVPYYNGHVQPKVPYNRNYYDLSKVSSIEWQAKIAKEHEISGFCIYHYYSLGKHLLEKPAELLNSTPTIDIDYFFSWANHDWRRNWYDYNKELLWKQEYGTDKDFEAHFLYLLKFFKDERYLKIENKPVFVIYKTMDIENIDVMMKIWNKLAVENGFDGVFFTSTAGGFGYDIRDINYDAFFEFEPDCSTYNNPSKIWKFKYTLQGHLRTFRNKYLPDSLKKIKFFVNYDYITNLSKNRTPDRENIFLGAFTNWDNTPRHKYNGRIIHGSNPRKFQEYIETQMKKSALLSNNIIIINAWNEWSEAAYLEPDEEWGYGYLEAVKKAKTNIEQ